MIKLTIVRGLVNHNGRYLFLKKAKDIVQENIGKWECPGGKIHDNEVPKQTLLREVEEETGLKCEIVKALPSLQANAKQITSKCFIYLLKAETDKVRLSPEHTEYKWIEPEKVKELPLVLFADLLLKYFNNPSCMSYDWDELKKLVHEKLVNEKTGHDYSHIERVLHNALKIHPDNINKEVLIAACLLHDISCETDTSKSHHITSAKQAEIILPKFGFSEKEIRQISHAIINHNRGFGNKVSSNSELSTEAKVLCDADRLDALGAIGLIRMILFSQKQGVPYFKSKEDKLDETVYGSIKYLLELAKEMFTEKGKKVALKRCDILKIFLAQLEEEYGK